MVKKDCLRKNPNMSLTCPFGSRLQPYVEKHLFFNAFLGILEKTPLFFKQITLPGDQNAVFIKKRRNARPIGIEISIIFL